MNKTYLLMLALAAGSATINASTVVAEWDNGIWGETASPFLHWGQTFVPTQSGILDAITVYGHRDTVWPAPPEVAFTVFEVVAPSTLLPLGADIVDASTLTELAVPITAKFSGDNIALNAGQRYAFGFRYPSPNNELIFTHISDIGYTGGALSRIFGDVIEEDPSGLSLRFQVTAFTDASEAVPDTSSTSLFFALTSIGMIVFRSSRRPQLRSA